jgi:hypothetical protein
MEVVSAFIALLRANYGSDPGARSHGAAAGARITCDQVYTGRPSLSYAKTR